MKIEDIKIVEADIKNCSEYNNEEKEFIYTITGILNNGFLDNDVSVKEIIIKYSPFDEYLVSKEDHKLILEYLKNRGRIDYTLLKDKSECMLEINNNIESILNRKTLELIAMSIEKLESGQRLIERLKKCGVRGWLINYPNTKRRMLDDIFYELSNSTNREDHNILFRFIENFMHPLMHNGDLKKAEEFEEKINNLLCYDGYKSKGMKIIRDEQEIDSFTNYIMNKRDGFVEPYKKEEKSNINQDENKNNEIEGEIFKLKPEFYGISVDLKFLWKKIKIWLENK